MVWRTLAALILGVAVCVSTQLIAQTGTSNVPFKLGTFERNSRTFIGLVLGDVQVVDIAAANEAFQASHTSARRLTPPSDMKQLILRYDGEWRQRLGEIAGGASSAVSTPAYIYPVTALKVLPPVRSAVHLNAGANYAEHEAGIAAQQRTAAPAPAAPPASSAPGIWERKTGDTRDNPYLFQKSPTVIIGANDNIVVPRGRTNIDFECEFAVVIGKPARYVGAADAADYVFGYTVHHDVSDRGGRGDRKMGGPDWLVQKNHDTFGPLGPYIVPKEFFKDPLNTRHTMFLNGQVMQDSNTNRMTHNIYELLQFASNVMTLNPGDVISGGSPAGTNIERAEPRWMRPGDTAKCDVEGIGALVNPVVAESSAATR